MPDTWETLWSHPFPRLVPVVTPSIIALARSWGPGFGLLEGSQEMLYINSFTLDPCSHENKYTTSDTMKQPALWNT